MTLWTPEYIDTALWLDAADSSTITESAGAVSAWADKSGNGLDFSQTLSSLQPSTTTLDGKNAIAFSGDYLSCDSSTIIGTNTFSFFCVCLPNATATIRSEATSGTSAVSGNRVIWYANQSPDVGLTVATNFLGSFEHEVSYAPYLSAIATTSSSALLFHSDVLNKDHRIYKNGSLIRDGLTSTKTNIYLSAVRLGGGLGWGDFSGSIGEVVILSGSLTADKRQSIEGYLAHKWGLSANLPTDHPYKSAAPQYYNFFGTITGADGNPAARTVRAYSHSTGALLGATTSDASGNYSFDIYISGEIYRIVLADEVDASGNVVLYNDIIDRVIPG